MSFQKTKHCYSFVFIIRIIFILVLSNLILNGCTVGPDYIQPQTDIPSSYKEDALWKIAKPADEYPRGEWWKVYKDTELNRLMELLNKQNLSIIQAESQYRQAQALLRQAQAGLFPHLSLESSRTRGVTSNSNNVISTQNQVIGTLSWEMDLWGGIRRNIEAGEAKVLASLAQLESIKLSSQAQLATAYLQLAITDLQISQLEKSETLFAETLTLTQNQFQAGIVSDASVAQAESQLKTAQTATIDLKLARMQLEHAIAASIGQPPSTFAIPRITTKPYFPYIPAGIPSTLLERRPDIAIAERKVAEANALVGVAKSAFFPSLTLSASAGWKSSSFGDLFTMPSRIWSLGPSVVVSIFDGGLKRAQTEEAIAIYDETVALYRQQVLNAFQEVEDNLAAQAILEKETSLQKDAVNAAKRAEMITLNRYNAGVVSYIDVLITQNSRITAENTLWDIQKRQFASSVSLIAAIGGKWDSQEEKEIKKDELNREESKPSS